MRGLPATTRHALVLLVVLTAIVLTFLQPRIPQPPGYHGMADERPWLEIPNAMNVLSNLPFAIVGLLGLVATFGKTGGRAVPWRDRWERWPYATLFAGVALTAAGSGYYHLAPDNARLVWDRLPMTIGFVGLLTAVLAERVSLGFARRLLIPLLVSGVGSVAYWQWSESRGLGDLRPYFLVQFGSLLVVLLVLILYPPSKKGDAYLFAGLAAYGLAKGVEIADAPLYSFGHITSGHTLKHLFAAAGVWCLVLMLQARASEPAAGTSRIATTT